MAWMAEMIAVLAAGRATRFGGGKLDAPLHGKPLGLWALLAAQSLGQSLGQNLGGQVCVVSGPQAPAFLDHAPGDWQHISNPLAHQGLGGSLAMAARYAEARGAGRLLVMLADMPFVTGESLRAVVSATTRATVQAACYPDGRLGPPACFGADHFGMLAALSGDQGAGALLREARFAHGFAMAPRELLDIDTPADLAAAQRLPMLQRLPMPGSDLSRT